MPTMSRFEGAVCRSRPWRVLAREVVLPWSLQGFDPVGDVLEIGAGSGAMAAELLARSPDVTMTVTDVDEAMVEVAAARLAGFGERVAVRQADATAVPFSDGSFDFVLSWIMLHHAVDWEQVLAESLRVLRPGGHVLGYDLVSTAPLRLLHRAEGAPFRMMRRGELRAVVQDLPVDLAVLTPGLAGLVVRFLLRKRAAESGPQ